MKYRKVAPQLWGSRKFRALSQPPPCASSLLLRLLTGPEMSAVPGLVFAGPAALAEAMGWPLDGFHAAWAELEQAGLAKADTDARIIWLPGELTEPENPNVAKHWALVLHEAPDSDLRDEVVRAVRAIVEGKGEAFSKPFRELFPEPLAEPSRNHDHDPKPEHEHEPEGERAGAPPPRRSSVSVGIVKSVAQEPESQRRPAAKARTTKNRTACPASAAPAAEIATWAGAEGVDAAHAEFQRFLDHHRKEAKTSADWAASWRTWLGNAPKFAARGPLIQGAASAGSPRAWAMIEHDVSAQIPSPATKELAERARWERDAPSAAESAAHANGVLQALTAGGRR